MNGTNYCYKCGSSPCSGTCKPEQKTSDSFTGLTPYMLLQVEQNNPKTSSCSQGSVASSLDNCPQDAAPFWTYTSEDIVTVPSVGGTFTIRVCNAAHFAQGQWVRHPLGRFPIIGKDPTSNLLMLRNSCDNGDAIPGNAIPGTSVGGQQIVWPVDFDCGTFEDFCTKTRSCFSSMSIDSEWCAPNMPEAAPDEILIPWGGTKACVDACNPDAPDPNCLRKITGFYFTNTTACFPSMTEVDGSPVSIPGLSGSTDVPKQLAIFSPPDYCLNRFENQNGVLSYNTSTSSYLWLDGADGDIIGKCGNTWQSLPCSHFYNPLEAVLIGFTNTNSNISANLDLAALSGSAIPANATHVRIRARARTQSIVSNILVSTAVGLDGRTVAIADVVEQFGVPSVDIANDFDTVTVPISPGGLVPYTVTLTNPGSGDNGYSFYMEGYYVPVCP